MSLDTAIGPARDMRRGRQWVSLERRADFLRIGGSGLKRVTPAFILQAAKRGVLGRASTNDAGPIHIGFTASRKIGNAVARNRAKRRLRALTDRLIAQADPSLDYVLIARTETLSHDFAKMESDLRHALTIIAVPREKGPRR